ncbi:hypothetical protein [Wenjunlia tyrosinilytica]|uniref:Alanine-rich protein n=1 Tax=Wenjunlia tyrosinilytica TaxID=1544741 RepID=A0A918DSR6_9ACTN|nr:hypothetical protein [Wenjunlia tyrosinilytica]GGO81343.1 hypothetical protein GCM10012280_05340 [Wenjunlia tyrosinilytica]
MKASAFLYPWDVVGDPEAPRRIAETGVRRVTLASAYHSTRALVPRHPRHRIVTARHAAVYYPPDPRRWKGRALRPQPQAWVASKDAFGEAAQALAEAGLAVDSWVILAHNSRLGEEYPRATVRNAYGDRYPWALCIARDEVREYLVDLAAEAAVRPGAGGTELESCGWYGVGHLHAHDKIGGVPLGGAAQYLMSLCFCRACRDGYAGTGVDPVHLRQAVVKAMDAVWRGEHRETPGGRAAEWDGVRELLGHEPAAATLAYRTAVALSFQREAVGAVRRAAREAAGGALSGPGGEAVGETAGEREFRVMLHADPAPHRCGANVGVLPEEILADADGLVLPCGAPEETAAVLGAAGRGRRPGSVLAANFTVVTGMGGRPGELAEAARHAAAHGADELRLYHAGLASDSDLARITRELARTAATPTHGDGRR